MILAPASWRNKFFQSFFVKHDIFIFIQFKSKPNPIICSINNFNIRCLAIGPGMMFVPGKNTIHGFEKRNIIGKRKSLIINYVLILKKEMFF